VLPDYTDPLRARVNTQDGILCYLPSATEKPTPIIPPKESRIPGIPATAADAEQRPVTPAPVSAGDTAAKPMPLPAEARTSTSTEPKTEPDVPTAEVGYTLEALTGPPNVTILVKYAGGPVGRGIKVHFANRDNPGYPNLRAYDRFTDRSGRIYLRGLHVARAGGEPLYGIVDGIPNILCFLSGDSSAAFTPASPLPAPAPAPAPAPLPAPASPLPAPAPAPAPLPAPASPLPAPAPAPLPAMSPVAASPVSVSPPESLASPTIWSLHPGLLKGQMQVWATQANYQLIWNSPNDFDLEAQSDFYGTFSDVVKQAFETLHNQGTPLRVVIHTGNRVLVVNDD
jgi:hypothetical protein